MCRNILFPPSASTSSACFVDAPQSWVKDKAEAFLVCKVLKKNAPAKAGPGFAGAAPVATVDIQYMNGTAKISTVPESYVCLVFCLIYSFVLQWFSYIFRELGPSIANPASLQLNFEDMVKMEEVNDATILHNLKHRFKEGDIYTKVTPARHRCAGRVPVSWCAVHRLGRSLSA